MDIYIYIYILCACVCAWGCTKVHSAKVNNSNPHKYNMLIFCDLSKAFDVINHDILIKKLNILGIRGIANKWFLN